MASQEDNPGYTIDLNSFNAEQEFANIDTSIV